MKTIIVSVITYNSLSEEDISNIYSRGFSIKTREMYNNQSTNGILLMSNRETNKVSDEDKILATLSNIQAQLFTINNNITKYKEKQLAQHS